MKVLIVDGDAPTSKALEVMLKAAAFNVYATDTGEEGVELAKLYDYDVIVLDVTLPDMSGFDVIRAMRRGGVDTPIMVLSAMALSDDKIKAFGLGADDYMTKPYPKDELVARLNAIVRRSRGHAAAIITTGRLAVNIDAKTVAVDGVDIPMTGSEYRMLELLALRKGMTIAKEVFLNHLYGGMDEPELKIIDVFICKLRKKLREASGGEGFIETVWGRGYTLGGANGPEGNMVPEVSSLIDDPPAGRVSRKTFLQVQAERKVARPAP